MFFVSSSSLMEGVAFDNANRPGCGGNGFGSHAPAIFIWLVLAVQECMCNSGGIVRRRTSRRLCVSGQWPYRRYIPDNTCQSCKGHTGSDFCKPWSDYGRLSPLRSCRNGRPALHSAYIFAQVHTRGINRAEEEGCSASAIIFNIDDFFFIKNVLD